MFLLLLRWFFLEGRVWNWKWKWKWEGKETVKSAGFYKFVIYISYVYAFGALLNFKFLFGWGGGDLNLQRLRADDALLPSPIGG